ncbi:MAG TPA: VOC family protein [Kofleriaceae bacterium]|nr:VOC family protein [Kofleriaceae bacterium]
MTAQILVNIDVPDLARAEAFYVAAFGLRPGRRMGAAGVELIGAVAPFYLLAKPAGTLPFRAARVGRDYGRHWTPVHLDFVVEDLVAARDRAVAAGAVLEGDIEERAWGGIAYLSAPFGNGFCLVRFTGQGYAELVDNM